MGYSTNFDGELKFTVPMTGKQLAKLNTMLGEDCREHPEWTANFTTNCDDEMYDEITYIDLELLDDFSGIKWNGSEKTYGMIQAINLIIREMNKTVSGFSLTGILEAQGEECDDRYNIEIINGIAQVVDVQIPGIKVECPNCGEIFLYDKK